MSQDNGRHDPMAPANANRTENSDNQYSQQGQDNQGRQDWNQQQASEGESGQSMGGDSRYGQSGQGQDSLGQAGIGQDQYGNRDSQAQQFDQGSGQQRGSSESDSDLLSQVREHMDVIGPDGQTIGRVDAVEGDRIKLTRDGSSDGQHHYITSDQIDGIENGQLRLSHYASSDSGAVSDMGYASTDSVNTGSGYASGK